MNKMFSLFFCLPQILYFKNKLRKKYIFTPMNVCKKQSTISLLYFYVSYSSKSKEKDNVEPVSEKKKVKEEKEDEKVEDVS